MPRGFVSFGEARWDRVYADIVSKSLTGVNRNFFESTRIIGDLRACATGQDKLPPLLLSGVFRGIPCGTCKPVVFTPFPSLPHFFLSPWSLSGQWRMFWKSAGWIRR